MSRPIPVLKRFDVSVYKNKSGTDTSQVPATGTIAFYREGATMQDSGGSPPMSSQVVPHGGGIVTINVYHTGAMIPGQTYTVYYNGNTAQVLTCDNVVQGVGVGGGSVRLTNNGTSDITITRGDRLVLATPSTILYDDPLGTAAHSPTNQLTLETSTGRARGYVSEYRFDYVIAVDGASTLQVLVDDEGSYVSR